MRTLVVLSHLMSKNCDLGVESIERSKLAIDKFTRNAYDNLITIGWDYRSDCATPIAEVVRRYISDHTSIDESSIIPLTKSRDTVGDAFYCLEFFSDIVMTELHIITSDYHVNRVNIIFNMMFNSLLKVKVFGASTAASNDPTVLQHEQESIEAFYKTFEGVDFSSKNSIFEALSVKHPFYNGEIYPKISDK